MNPGDLTIQRYRETDAAAVVALWRRCGLVVPRNDPLTDIRLKTEFQWDGFLMGRIGGDLVATVMAGYEGHRGWLNYLAVDPAVRRRGIGRAMVKAAANWLHGLDCPKINVQIRETNLDAVAFYRHIGFSGDAVVSMGLRLDDRRR